MDVKSDRELVAGDIMERSLDDFVRALCAYIQNEQMQRSPDNTLISLLGDGVRLARESELHLRRITAEIDREPLAAALHCKQCLTSKPRHIAPKDWARLEVSLTDKGCIQVWCLRHDRHVYTSRVPVVKSLPGCDLCAAGTSHPKH
jgi:hypothetical protein